MNPRVTLGISLVILVLTYVGARFYVGRMLTQPAAPATVNTIEMPSRPHTPPPAVPDPEPEPGEQAYQDVEGAAVGFTALIELEGEDRAEAAAQALEQWQALDDETVKAVPEEHREELIRILELIPSQIPDEPGMASFEAAYLEKRAHVYELLGR